MKEVKENFESELSCLRQNKIESDSSIKTLELQKSKALELAKKVKEAAAAKLKKANEDKASIGEKYSKEILSLKEEKLSLESMIESVKKEMIESKDAEIAKLQSDFKASLEESITTANEDLKRAIDDKCQADERVAELSKKLEDVMKNINSSETMQADFEKEKIEAIEVVKSEMEKRLKAATEENESASKDLQRKMEKHADDVRAFYESKLNNVRKEAETSNAALEKKLSSALSSCKSITEDNTTLQNQLKTQMTSELTLRDELKQLKIKMRDSISNNEAATSSLLEEQEKISNQNNSLKKEVASLTNTQASKDNKIEELNGKLNALKENLDEISSQKRKIESDYELASKQVDKLDATKSELDGARVDLNRFKLELTQSRALLQKLQAEKDSTEKKHGQRTALVGMLEAQLSEANDNRDEVEGKLEAAFYDIKQRDDEISYLKEEVEKSHKAVAEAQAKAKTLMKSTTAQATSSADKEYMAKKTKMVESLQREVATLQQQMARKTSAAQRLLQERESDCKELKKRNKQLQQELDKGSLSDRRIFELAAQQSNRDSVASAEIEIRNRVVEQLTDKLVTQDGDLASAELMRKQIEAKVEELSRIQRREDLNIDYLKSIIVQFLSKPSGSSEREALLPVIATLLQVINLHTSFSFLFLSSSNAFSPALLKLSV